MVISALDTPDMQRHLQRLIHLGRARDYVTWDEINEVLPVDSFDLELVEDLLAILQKLRISLVDHPQDRRVGGMGKQETPADADAEDRPESDGEDEDPVRQYLRQIAGCKILTRDEEQQCWKERQVHLDRARALGEESEVARGCWMDSLGQVAAGSARGDQWFCGLPPRLQRQQLAASLQQKWQAWKTGDPLPTRRIAVRPAWVRMLMEKIEAIDPDRFGRMEKEMKEAGDWQNKVVEGHLKLVLRLARPFTERGLPFLDLVQEGNIALAKAADRFPWTPGFGFTPYASQRIRQGIATNLARQARPVQGPRSRRKELAAVLQKQQLLAQKLGREPSREELQKAMGLSARDLLAILRSAPGAISLSTPSRGDTRDTRADTLPDETSPGPQMTFASGLLRERMKEAMDDLDPREKRVLASRFGWKDGVISTIKEIADDLGVSEERVRQLEARALQKLRHPTRLRHLEEFLPDD
jgi:RNA polymerase sigma factor (sigma-70 family)